MTNFTRFMSAVAYAPAPTEPDHGYEIPPNLIPKTGTRRAHARSPFAPTVALSPTGTHLIPHTPSPIPVEALSGWYRPHPAPNALPAPTPYETEAAQPHERPIPQGIHRTKASDWLAAEAASPTGRWLRLPTPNTNAHYYRQRYPAPAAEFRTHKCHLYARFRPEPDAPAAPDPRIPADAYQDPGPSHAATPLPAPRTPNLIHLFLRPDASRAAISRVLPEASARFIRRPESRFHFLEIRTAATAEGASGEFMQRLRQVSIQYGRFYLLHPDTPADLKDALTVLPPEALTPIFCHYRSKAGQPPEGTPETAGA